MYKPLGLGCGHKFCTECVLSVVRVEGADLLKPLRRILADVPHGTACPQCRQRAVFYNAVELKKLGAFIYATCGPPRNVSSLCFALQQMVPYLCCASGRARSGAVAVQIYPVLCCCSVRSRGDRERFKSTPYVSNCRVCCGVKQVPGGD